MNPHPIKILIADDEDVIREIMARKIASQNYEIVTAKDGQEAWDKIVSEMPDIIILDLNMPKMDGWAVLSRLRSNPPSKRWQPVIIVSAHDEVLSYKRAVELGADHYLSKPCRIEDIFKAIRLMLALIPQRNP